MLTSTYKDHEGNDVFLFLISLWNVFVVVCIGRWFSQTLGTHGNKVFGKIKLPKFDPSVEG